MKMHFWLGRIQRVELCCVQSWKLSCFWKTVMLVLVLVLVGQSVAAVLSCHQPTDEQQRSQQPKPGGRLRVLLVLVPAAPAQTRYCPHYRHMSVRHRMPPPMEPQRWFLWLVLLN
jgi:hypothetical protein